jgi:hypothetical protein
MDVVKVDVDGAGVSLDQQSRKALSHTIAYGRAGMLTDYPTTEGPATVKEVAGERHSSPDDHDLRPLGHHQLAHDHARRSEAPFPHRVISRSRCRLMTMALSRRTNNYYRVLRLKYDGEYWSQVWYSR